MATIYDRVAARAKEKGLPIYKVEKMAGIGNGVISGWKEGEPRLDTLRKVTKVLGCTIDELIRA